MRPLSCVVGIVLAVGIPVPPEEDRVVDGGDETKDGSQRGDSVNQCASEHQADVLFLFPFFILISDRLRGDVRLARHLEVEELARRVRVREDGGAQGLLDGGTHGRTRGDDGDFDPSGPDGAHRGVGVAGEHCKERPAHEPFLRGRGIGIGNRGDLAGGHARLGGDRGRDVGQPGVREGLDRLRSNKADHHLVRRRWRRWRTSTPAEAQPTRREAAAATIVTIRVRRPKLCVVCKPLCPSHCIARS